MKSLFAVLVAGVAFALSPTTSSAAEDKADDKVAACVAECRACAAECLACMKCCADAGRPECSKMDEVCHHVCLACAGQMERGSKNWKATTSLCEKTCLECAAECEKHDDECCKKCAEACRKCAKVCAASMK